MELWCCIRTITIHLAPNRQVDPNYPFVESSAWGDLFSSIDPLIGGKPPYKAYVCAESDLASTCGSDSGLAEIKLRICDKMGAQCGLTFKGVCGSPTSGCVNVGGYWSCGTNAQTVRVQLHNAPACK